MATEPNTKIKWTFKNQSLREVLKEIADVYEIGFVFSDDIVDHVRITCEIEDLTFKEAISLILEKVNLDYQLLPHQVIVITTKDTPGFEVPDEVVIIHKKAVEDTMSMTPYAAIFPPKTGRRMPTVKRIHPPASTIPISIEYGLVTFLCKDTSAIAYWNSEKQCMLLNSERITPPALVQSDSKSLLFALSQSTYTVDDLKTDPIIHNTSMYFDGIPIYHTSHMWGLTSALNNEAIASIDYIPVSSIKNHDTGLFNTLHYDSPDLKPDSTCWTTRLHTLGINTWTKLSLNQNVHTFFSFRRSYLWNVHPSLNRSIEDITFTQNKNYKPNYLESPFYNYQDFISKISMHSIHNLPIHITYFYTQDQINISDELVNLGETEEKWKNRGIGLQTSHRWNLFHHTELNIAYSDYKNNATYSNPFFTSNAYSEKDEMRHFKTNIKHRWMMTTDWNLYFNTHFQRQKLNQVFHENQFVYTSNKINTQIHQSLAIVHQLNPKLLYKTELNLIYSSLQKKIYIEPFAAITWTIGPIAQVGIQYKYGIQEFFKIAHANFTSIPKLSQDFWFFLESPNKPVQAHKVGLTFSITIFDWHLSGLLHENDYSHIPYLLPGDMLNQSTPKPLDDDKYIDQGKTMSRGISIIGQRKMGYIHTLLSCHFNHTKNQFRYLNQNKSFPSNNRAQAFKCYMAYHKNTWQITALYTFTSGKNYTYSEPDYTITPSGPDYLPQINTETNMNNFQLPWYNRLDISAAYCFKNKTTCDWKVGISILNILNTKNIISPYHYTLTSGNAQVIQNSAGFMRTGMMFVEVTL